MCILYMFNGIFSHFYAHLRGRGQHDLTCLEFVTKCKSS